MSSNPPSGPGRPKRVHAPLRRFYHVRGPGNKREERFVGQDEDEKIRRKVRKHKWFLFVAALPLISSILLLLGLFALQARFPDFGPIWTVLEIIAGILILVTGVYFVYKDFILWWLNVDVVTDKRILTWRGFLHQTRQVTPLDKVQQVAVDQRTLWSILLSYGLVHVYLSGGQGLVLNDVPRPKEVRDAIEGIWQEFKQSQPPKEPIPEPQDKELAGALTKLAKYEPIPKLPDADAKWEHRRSSKMLRRPLRTFGGPLRIECDVHYDSEEYSVKYVQRSRWVLAVKLVVPVLLLLAALVTPLYVPAIFPFTAFGFVIVLVAIGLIIINYVDDVFILTNKRIIDIERNFIFFFEEHDTTTYDKIRDIKVISPNLIELALGIGDVFIETQGSDNPDIKMTHIAKPFNLQDEISEIRDTKEKVDKAKAKNERTEQLHTWFGTVLTTLETKLVNRGVPNLQKLDLWTAAERASEFGMKVVPVGEDSSYPHIGSGKIVHQMPPPGTLLNVDPARPEERPQIQVVLSARPRGMPGP